MCCASELIHNYPYVRKRLSQQFADVNVHKFGLETTAVWIAFLLLYVFLYLLQPKSLAFDDGPSQPIRQLFIVISVIGDDQRVETRVRSRQLFGIRTCPVL
jgi:hypothetical protein